MQGRNGGTEVENGLLDTVEEGGGGQMEKIASTNQFSHSCVWLFVTPWTAACQASLSITNSWSLLKLMSIKSVMPSNYLILCLLIQPSHLHPLSVYMSCVKRLAGEQLLCNTGSPVMRWGESQAQKEGNIYIIMADLCCGRGEAKQCKIF